MQHITPNSKRWDHSDIPSQVRIERLKDEDDDEDDGKLDDVEDVEDENSDDNDFNTLRPSDAYMRR